MILLSGIGSEGIVCSFQPWEQQPKVKLSVYYMIDDPK